MSVHRRLSALFFADIVDYSDLSAHDEAAALRLVPVFQTATRAAVHRYGGRIVKFLGDGVLAEFPSTGNAIGSAEALRGEFRAAAAAAGLGEARLRIGVHMGDIAVSDDGDVYGDGVNVTSRLCEDADTGGILASEDVYRQLKQRSEFEFEPRGERALKGVGPVAAYAVRVKSPVEPDLEQVSAFDRERGSRRLPPQWAIAAMALLAVGLAWGALRGPWFGTDAAESATLDPARLAVLYFRDLSEDGVLGHLAAGFTESLIQELSRIEGLRVVSQYGVEPYEGGEFPIDSVARVLEAGTIIDGAVSRAGDSLRVRLHVVDARDRTRIASFTEVRPWDEMFSLQDEITAEVSMALRQHLGRELVLQARRRATDSVEAWELAQRAERMSEQAVKAGEEGEVRPAMWESADSLLTVAADLDPQWAEPPLAQARMALRVGTEESLTRGLEAVERALDRHADDADAFSLRGALRMALAHQAGDSTRAARLLAAAERDLRTAVASDPESAQAWITLADLLYHDRWDLSEARDAARRAYEEDVFLLEEGLEGHFRLLCETSIQLRDYEEAARWCAEGRRRFPDDVYLMMSDLTRLASGGPANPEAGWALVREIGRQRYPEFNVPAAKMYMAAILARAGAADSARATALDARRGLAAEERAALAPSLDYIEAYVRLLLRDERTALRLLRSSFTGYPPYRANAARDYWFDGLAGDPRFEALVDRVHLPIFCRILCEPPD